MLGSLVVVVVRLSGCELDTNWSCCFLLLLLIILLGLFSTVELAPACTNTRIVSVVFASEEPGVGVAPPGGLIPLQLTLLLLLLLLMLMLLLAVPVVLDGFVLATLAGSIGSRMGSWSAGARKRLWFAMVSSVNGLMSSCSLIGRSSYCISRLMSNVSLMLVKLFVDVWDCSFDDWYCCVEITLLVRPELIIHTKLTISLHTLNCLTIYIIVEVLWLLGHKRAHWLPMPPVVTPNKLDVRLRNFLISSFFHFFSLSLFLSLSLCLSMCFENDEMWLRMEEEKTFLRILC